MCVCVCVHVCVCVCACVCVFEGEGTYSHIVGQAVSFKREPSSLPDTNIVRVSLFQISHLVITL